MSYESVVGDYYIIPELPALDQRRHPLRALGDRQVLRRDAHRQGDGTVSRSVTGARSASRSGSGDDPRVFDAAPPVVFVPRDDIRAFVSNANLFPRSAI